MNEYCTNFFKFVKLWIRNIHFFQNSPQNESFYYKNAIVIQIHKNILLTLMIFILFDIKDDDSAIEKLMKTRKRIVSSLRHQMRHHNRTIVLLHFHRFEFIVQTFHRHRIVALLPSQNRTRHRLMQNVSNSDYYIDIVYEQHNTLFLCLLLCNIPR